MAKLIKKSKKKKEIKEGKKKGGKLESISSNIIKGAKESSTESASDVSNFLPKKKVKNN